VDPLRPLKIAVVVLFAFMIALAVAHPGAYPTALVVFLGLCLAVSVWVIDRARRGR
jgi:protein-S-isoprenylcysteine O-methyltransferase Ste14